MGKTVENQLRMKLYSWGIIVSVSGQEEPKEPKTCDLNALILPENALGWICSENSFYSNDLILKSGKCSIDCQDGYIATSELDINAERTVGSIKIVFCSD